MQQQARCRELSKIHIAKKQLGLDDETYREMLWNVAGVRSAADLDDRGRQKVLRHMESCGFQPTRGRTAHPGQPRALFNGDRGPMLRKIEALLAEKGRRGGRYIPWSYALEILNRQYGIERLEWAKPEHLQGVIAALSVHDKRGKRRENHETARRQA